MTDSPLDDAIARQYGRWIYPDPAQDLDVYSQTRRGTCDPALVHDLFWPDREYPRALDILVAGCGANEAAEIAYQNRGARVLGIDVSEPSLAHERYLQRKHNLDNLELLRLPIEDVSSLGRDFDLITASGVLHHMAEPLAGMKALGSCLRRDGVIAVFLYGHHGRVGLEILQTLFRDIGLGQDEASLAVVKRTLESLPAQHPLRPETLLPDAGFDAGLVDLFLNPRERSYTVEDCLRFVSEAGLVFQNWVENAYYYPDGWLNADHPLFAALASLPTPAIWAVTDLYLCNRGHFFAACRPDRPPEQYRLDPGSADDLRYIPVRRANTIVAQAEQIPGAVACLQRRGVRTVISDAQARLLNEVDGRRSVEEVAAGAMAQGLPGTASEVESFAREYFASLWRMGLIFFRLPRAP
jgi:SAM-dependent methyltransferase